MITFIESISIFIRGICRNRISIIGASVTTVTFPLLIISIILDFTGIIHTEIFGALVYLVLTPIFLLGHAIFFFGFFFVPNTADQKNVFSFDFFKTHLKGISSHTSFRKIILFSSCLAVINFIIILIVAFNGHHYTETPEFCGMLCHTSMDPEYVSYKNSPHSRVACVECHVGSGLKWFVSSKIAGSRQLLAMATKSFSKPIPVPVHGLRPARETCEQCHFPELFIGGKLVVINKYSDDEENSLSQTVLLLNVGSGGNRGTKATGIHWHVSGDNKISYIHLDEERQIISQVKLHKSDGTEVIYFNSEVEQDAKIVAGTHLGSTKAMDCVDCHSRPTHIYLSINEALNGKIETGVIPKELPFIKQQATIAIRSEYASQEEASYAIAEYLNNWYQENYPQIVNNNGLLISRAIEGTQAAYRENNFPSMKIDWDTYRQNVGHEDGGGCFRCHNESFESEDGMTGISQDCELCHVILAEEESDPEIMRTLRGE